MYQFYSESGGAVRDTDYPFIGRESDFSCKADGLERVAQVDDYGMLEAKATAMIERLQVAPISVAIQAYNQFFFSYKSGILRTDECYFAQADHEVTLTGFNSNGATGSLTNPVGGTPYFTIQNNWGVAWGDAGTARFAADFSSGSAGPCGINSAPMYVTGHSLI